MQGGRYDTDERLTLISLLPYVERCNIPIVMDATNSGEDAVIRQKGGWDGLVNGNRMDGSLQGRGGGGGQSGGHAEGLSLTGVVGG